MQALAALQMYRAGNALTRSFVATSKPDLHGALRVKVVAETAVLIFLHTSATDRRSNEVLPKRSCRSRRCLRVVPPRYFPDAAIGGPIVCSAGTKEDFGIRSDTPHRVRSP